MTLQKFEFIFLSSQAVDFPLRTIFIVMLFLDHTSWQTIVKGLARGEQYQSDNHRICGLVYRPAADAFSGRYSI